MNGILAVSLAVFCGLAALNCAASAQTQAGNGPDFYVVSGSFLDSTAEARTDIFIFVPYTELIFKNFGEWRKAEWEVEGVLLYDGAVRGTTTKNQIEKIPAGSDEDRSARRVSMHPLSVRGMPDRYRLELTVTDKSTGRLRKKEFDLVLRPISKTSLGISDPLFLGDLVYGEDKALAFLDPQRLDHRKPFAFVFELYAPDAIRDLAAVVVNYKIRKANGKEVISYADTLQNVYVPKTGRLIAIVRVLPDTLSSGFYVLELYVSEPRLGLQSDIVRREIGFFSDWPNSPEEMKEAFTALGYIEPQIETAIKRAPTKEEKLRIFNRAFETDEYNLGVKGVDTVVFISRLTYVNERYSLFKKRNGWKTPRGRIYIKFGLPDSVRPYMMSGRRLYSYEVWYYSSQPQSWDKERIFVFVNKGEEWQLDYNPRYLPEIANIERSRLNDEF